MGDRLSLAQSLGGLALPEIELGRCEQAEALLEEALDIFSEAGQRDFIAETLEAIATIAQRRGELFRAARLYSGAERLRSDVLSGHAPADLARHQSALESLRQAMGREEFEAAWTVGRIMSDERLLAEASPQSVAVRA